MSGSAHLISSSVIYAVYSGGWCEMRNEDCIMVGCDNERACVCVPVWCGGGGGREGVEGQGCVSNKMSWQGE